MSECSPSLRMARDCHCGSIELSLLCVELAGL
jgi:hypothetical protein